MPKYLCQACKMVYDEPRDGRCPHCGESAAMVLDFSNSDEYLKQQTPKVIAERKHLGLVGLVGSLAAVIINTEGDRQKAAASELLRFTGYVYDTTFEEQQYTTCALKCAGSADFLIRSRKDGKNPFLEYSLAPKSRHLPNTRLETLVFHTVDIEKYVEIQKARGIRFLTDDIIRRDHYAFIQTRPSRFTGNSIGLIQWHGEKGNYKSHGDRELPWNLRKPDYAYLRNIGRLDHCATRIRAKDRDPAIMEFMNLTNYKFDFAIYVKSQNSITNVSRLSMNEYAMVFTSGIAPYVSDELSGPTEKFIHNYNTRVHHMAFTTKDIENVFAELGRDGMDYLVNLVGSEDEGLKQTFTVASPTTLLVNEYIHRYGDFDGFFTRSNVTLLTEATKKQ